MKPACMNADEFTAWEDANRTLRGDDRADSPCRDCLPLYHRDMAAGGMCNGAPGPRPSHRERLPSELRHLTYAELRALRKSLPHFAPPPELVLATQRARWREYQQRRRDARFAVAGAE
jgi:hypothetical protein